MRCAGLPETMIKLVPMPYSVFQKHLRHLVVDYAKEHVKAGNWTQAESLSRSRQELKALLPKGLKTPGHHLFSIVIGPLDRKVGIVWLSTLSSHGGKGIGFIFDLLIDPPERRKGYAYEALRALEEFAKGQGLKSLQLHVFAHNTSAIALYRKLGYAETNVVMGKALA